MTDAGYLPLYLQLRDCPATAPVWLTTCRYHPRDDSKVLRVTTRHTDDSLSLILEGRIKGPWVGELEQAWLAAQKLGANKLFKIDLTGVTFADWRGRKLLLDMQRRGAELVGGSSFVRQMLAGTKNFGMQDEN